MLNCCGCYVLTTRSVELVIKVHLRFVAMQINTDPSSDFRTSNAKSILLLMYVH